MQPFKKAAGVDLDWKSGGLFSREYALVGGEQVFATLKFGAVATAKTAQESWTFKRRGFLPAYVSARVAGTETEVARIPLAFGGSGTLALKAGRKYEWADVGFWNGKWRFIGATGKVAVLLEPCPSLFKTDYRVVMEDCTHPDMPLLVTIGWYMVLLRQQQSG